MSYWKEEKEMVNLADSPLTMGTTRTSALLVVPVGRQSSSVGKVGHSSSFDWWASFS